MSYDLSFSQSFFYGEGDEDIVASARPTNVLQAIESMPASEKEEIAITLLKMEDKQYRDLFLETADFVYAVLTMIQQTNTCSDLRSPVTVWIDAQGYYTVDVYDVEDQ